MRLDGSEPENTPRVGNSHRLGLSVENFAHLFSVRAKEVVHVNIMDAEAFVLLSRWLLRTRHQHCHRVVILLDSKVLLGAAAKSCSSSRALNRLLRKAAAMVFAGDLYLRLVFVPSSDMPADAPSRAELR